MLDLDGTLLDANEAALAFGGVSAAEVIGRKFWDTPWWNIGQEEQERLRASIARAAAGEFVRYDVSVMAAGGVRTAIGFSLKPVVDADGRVVEIILEGRDLTALRSAEMEARRNAERLGLLVDGATDIAILMLDPDGRIEAWNSGAERLKGWTAAEAVGQPYELLFTPADQAAGKPAAQLAIAREQGVFDAEDLRIKADGSNFIARVRLTALWNDGELRGFAKVTRDVTAQRAAEEALSERSEQLETAIQQSPFGVAILDRKMCYLAASANFATQLGVPAEVRLIGRSHYDVFPDLPPEWREAHRQVLEDGAELSATNDRFERADGTVYWTRWAMKPWRRADESIGGMVLFGEDITEEHDRRASLQAAETRYRAMFENAAIGVARVAFEGEALLEVNDAFCAITGYSRDELVGRSWVSITHPDDVELDLHPFRRMAAGEIDTYCVEKRYIRKDGRPVWVKLTLSVVRQPDGQPDFEICLVEDIDERRAAEIRDRFRLALTETLRDLTDPDEMMAAAFRLVGQHLGVAQVGFADTENDQEHIFVR